MSEHRSKFAIWNFISGLTFFLVTLGTALCTSPFIVRFIGDERFGAFRTIAECFGYLTLLELGLNGAMGPLLARALGQNDRKAIAATLSVGIRAYAMASLVAIAVGFGLAVAIPWLVPVSPPLRLDLRLASLVMLLGFLTMGLLPLRSLTDAAQRGYRVNLLLATQAAMIGGLSLLLSWGFPSWGITALCVANISVITVIILIISWDGLRQYPGLFREILTTRPQQAVWRSVWGLSLPALLISLCSRISLYSDNIVMSKVLGTALVTTLFITRRLPQVAEGLLSSVSSATWAGLMDLYNKGELVFFRARLVELVRLVTILAVVGLGPIFAYTRHFVTLWMGAEYYGGDLLVLAAAANSLLLSLLAIANWCIMGSGRIRRVLVPSILSAIINLGSSVFFTLKLGVAGPVLGTTFTISCWMIWWYVYLLHSEFGISPWKLVRAVLVPLAHGVPFVLVLWWLARVHSPVGWLGLLLEMGTASLLFLGWSVRFLLSVEERTVWRDRILKLRRPAVSETPTGV